MESLKFEIPKGYQIDTFDKEKGLITFKELPKKVTERIKSFWDVLADRGISMQDWEKQIEGLPTDEVAYKQSKLITAALNEGWTPDWGNSNEYKYYPWFNMGSSSGSRFAYLDCDDDCSNSAVGSRLCFKSRELAEYAANQFTDIYKQFYLI